MREQEKRKLLNELARKRLLRKLARELASREERDAKLGRRQMQGTCM